MRPRDFIHRFTAPDDVRYYMTLPSRDGGALYATNGHIMITTADDEIVRTVLDSPLPEKFRTLYAAISSQVGEFSPLVVSLPEPTPCPICNGLGRANKCPLCSDDENDDPYCPKCGGSGEIPSPDGEIACWHCDGRREDLTVIPLGATHFARYYMAILLMLPGIEIALNTSPTGAALFRSDVGYGALMPCRP